MSTFWDRVEQSGDCWLWTGRQVRGYGFCSGGRLAHRVAYTEMVGEIPAGLELDHLCRRKACVNPEHLEPVTGLVNAQRRFALQTHCVRGHAFDEANTAPRTNGGQRACRACSRDNSRRYAQRQKQKVAIA